MIDEAIAFAAVAHAGQTRKYNGDPYIVHPVEVMQLLRRHSSLHTTEMMCAAILHDVVEDCEVTLDTINRRFGIHVRMMVDDLTSRFTKKAFPSFNREKRKAHERERLRGISNNAKTVKLADIMSNCRGLAADDPDFAKVYLPEKVKCLDALFGGDFAMHARCRTALIEECKRAGVEFEA